MIRNILKKIYQKQKIFSELNGEITVYTYPFSYEIWCGQCYQSAPYIDRMWRKILKKIQRDDHPRRFLMFGLGGGGGIFEILKRYPSAQITVVEYDPVMVDIAKKTYLKKINPHTNCALIKMGEQKIEKQPHKMAIGVGVKNEKLEIIQAEAAAFAGKCNRKFDVIIIDLFKGKNPSPILGSDIFLENLKKILNNSGYLLVNFYGHKKKFQPPCDKYFSRHENLLYAYNELAVYRHFGMGNPKDPLPNGYKNKEQAPTFWKSQIIFPKIDRPVSAGGILGINRNMKICEIENYVSVSEPIAEKSSRPKIVFWQPLIYQKKLSGWRVNHIDLGANQKGLAIVEDENYWQKWSGHAKRHRKNYLKDDSYEIIEADPDSFMDAYKKCGKLDAMTRAMFLRGLKINDQHNHDNLHLYAARDIKDKKIFAGLAVVNHPEISLSRHFISFINKGVYNTSAGYGLIDYWHKDCLKKNIKFLNFGIIWEKGDPAAWRGYSQFKKQFNLHIMRQPRSLFKIIW